MKNLTNLTLVAMVTFLVFNILFETCEARGGRGRGGGSFGGIFGGWRKYKKPASNSNSRRIISSSPMQTTATKSMSSNPTQVSMNSMKQPKQQASYPKQQAPLGSGYNTHAGYNGNYASGTPPLPPGGTYYSNMGAMPPGAIYYPQPMRSSSGSGDFLFGMLAGHMASNMLLGPRHYVTHVHHENANQNGEAGPKIIVVNNGEVTTLNTTSPPKHYWPTDTDTPLEPFNESVTPSDALQHGAAAQTPSSVPPNPPTNGIICVPVLLNETNPADSSKVQQVERVICFPAPPPPPAPETANANCAVRNIIETDPNDPSKTIEVPKEICNTLTTTSEPRQVAGEIGESTAIEATTILPENDESETQGSDGADAATTEGSLGASTESENPTTVESKK